MMQQRRNMNKAIVAEKLSKHFGSTVAVENLNIEINTGEVIGLLGPNGAGKTTTIRMLAGLIGHTSGKVQVLGLDVPAQALDLHEKIGLLTEMPGLYENLSAEYNLRYFAGFYEGINPDKQVEKYLKLTGLYERRKERAGRFSKGMKHRLAIARALLNEPELVFFDEPTSGLDPEAASDIRELIRTLKTEGRTIILSTHNLDEAMKLSDRIAILKTTLLLFDKPHDLLSNAADKRIVIKSTDIPECINALRKMRGILAVDVPGTEIEVRAEKDVKTEDILKKLVEQNIEFSQIYEKEYSLEELYLAAVKKDVANV